MEGTGPPPSCPAWVTGAMDGCTCAQRWTLSSCGGGRELGCPPKSTIQILSFLCARDRPTEPWAGGCQGPLEGNASDLIPSLIASGLTQVLHTVGSVSYSIHRHSINIHSQTRPMHPALGPVTLGCPGAAESNLGRDQDGGQEDCSRAIRWAAEDATQSHRQEQARVISVG